VAGLCGTGASAQLRRPPSGRVRGSLDVVEPSSFPAIERRSAWGLVERDCGFHPKPLDPLPQLVVDDARGCCLTRRVSLAPAACIEENRLSDADLRISLPHVRESLRNVAADVWRRPRRAMPGMRVEGGRTSAVDVRDLRAGFGLRLRLAGPRLRFGWLARIQLSTLARGRSAANEIQNKLTRAQRLLRICCRLSKTKSRRGEVFRFRARRS
jgi:hypothetical protein